MASGIRSRNWLVTVAAVACAAALLSLQLLVPPVVGLANEGDFERVMGYAGFFYQTDKFEEKYYGHVVREFAIVAPGWYASGYLTSETLLALAARWISIGLFPGRVFDIRILAAIHMLLLLAAIGLLIRAIRDLSPVPQWVAAALIVLVFSDVGYAAALNSFYAQTASLLFVLLTAAWAAVGIQAGALRTMPLVFYFLSAALFVCSKPQEVVHAPLLGAFGVLLALGAPFQRRIEGSWRRAVLPACLALALGGLAVWYYSQTPRIGIRYVGLFHTVFHELLQNSPDPGRDMAELGIDPELGRYIGMHAYMKGAPIEDPEFRVRFFDRFGYARLMAFYLRHPARLADRLERAAPAAFRLRPKYLGNFEKVTGAAPRAKSTRFALWSDLRARLQAHAGVALIAFFGANLLVVALAYKRSAPRVRLFLAGIVVCLVTAGLEFGVCAFADALDDLGRHLFVFDALCDLVLIADVVWLVQAVSSLPRGRGSRGRARV